MTNSTNFVTGTQVTKEWLNDIDALRFDADGASLLSYTPAGIGAVATNVQGKLMESVSVLDFFANGVSGVKVDPTGVVDSTLGIQAAMTYANTVSKNVYIPSGSYKISTSIKPAKSGVYGDGQAATVILCNSCSAFEFTNGYVLGRQPCVIEKLSISSFASSCDSQYAFIAPGVAPGAVVIYNSGITILDVAINNRFGGGFYLKDCFEVNVDRIVMTDVGRPVLLAGSVVQSYFSRISAFGDSAPTTLGYTGFETEIANYASGVQLGPEHITTTDCSWIYYDIGVHHKQGLMVSFINTDVQTTDYGMLLSNPCVVIGGIMAARGDDAAGWVGIYTPTVNFQIEDAIFITSVIIQPLTTPAYPFDSKGIVIGDGVSEKRGVVIDKCVFKGNAQLRHAIFSSKSHGFNITNCMISDSVCLLNEFEFDMAYSAYIVGNKFGSGGGNIIVNNGAGGGDHGCISSNDVNGGSVTVTSGAPGNWLVQNNF